MTKVILADRERVDVDLSLTQSNILNTINEQSLTKENVMILPITNENLKVLDNNKYEVYLPSSYLIGRYENNDNVSVYFDLENYGFYQSVKEIIKKESKPKGILRFRRMVKQGENISSLASDLYVLSHLLGGAVNIQIKQTSQSVTPAHTIVLVNFDDGTMAHVEYTVSDREQVEIEWSGVENILELDSDEMNTIQSGDQTKLPFLYTVDSILNTAHAVNQKLVDQLKQFESIVDGGGLE